MHACCPHTQSTCSIAAEAQDHIQLLPSSILTERLLALFQHDTGIITLPRGNPAVCKYELYCVGLS